MAMRGGAARINLRARSLAPIVKTRGFGMIHFLGSVRGRGNQRLPG